MQTGILQKHAPYMPQSAKGDFTSIKKRIDADYAMCKGEWQRACREALIDIRLEAGDPTLNIQLSPNQQTQYQQPYFFNRSRPLGNLVSGIERRSRKSTIVAPLENGDNLTADQLTKVLMGIYKRDNVNETLSDAFHAGAVVTGQAFIQLYLDFTNDPVNGDLRYELVPYQSIFADMNCRKWDLSDASFIWRRSFVTPAQACMLLPEHEKDILLMRPMERGTQKFSSMPEVAGTSRNNRLSYDEYYYRDYRKARIVIDKQTTMWRDLDDPDVVAMDIDVKQLLAENPRAEYIEQLVPTVRLCIMVNEMVMYDGPQPISGLDDFPFVRVTGYFSPDMPQLYMRAQGIMRSLRDPQIHFNRRMMLTADYSESVSTSGWIFKENAVLDVKTLFNTGAGRVIPLKDSASMDDLRQIMPNQIPPGYFEMQNFYAQEFHFDSGVNEDMMGAGTDDKMAGILSAIRQSAGQVTLQPILDHFNLVKKKMGELSVKIVQKNFTHYKVSLFLEGEEPTQEFFDKIFGLYHCCLESGFDTDSQRQLEMAQLVQLKELGLAGLDEAIIEAAQIQNKDKIIQQMQQASQQTQQIAMQQAQSETEEAQARIRLADARALSDTGQGYERMSRVEDNEAQAVERKAKSELDKTESFLNFVKALKEIDAADIGHMREYIEMHKLMTEPKEPKAAAKPKAKAKAKAGNPARRAGDLPRKAKKPRKAKG